MKSYEKIETDFKAYKMIKQEVIRPSEWGEVLGNMIELHKHKEGYPETKSSFYLIHDNKCSRILYVDNNKKLYDVLQELLVYQVESVSYLYQSELINMPDIYCSIEELIKKNVLKIDFYLIVIKGVVKSKKRGLCSKISKCIENKENPIEKIRILKSFESVAPNIPFDIRFQNIIYERLLYDIGVQTSEEPCVFPSFKRIGHNQVTFLYDSPFRDGDHRCPKKWAHNFLQIRNNMNLMRDMKEVIPSNELSSFYFRHFGTSDRLYISKREKLCDILQRVLELNVYVYLHQSGRHFFTKRELGKSVGELIDQKIIKEDEFFIWTDYCSELTAEKEHPNAVLEEIGTFNRTLSIDREFSKKYQKYISNVGTQTLHKDAE